MGRLIKTAFTIGFTVLVQRLMSDYFDAREEKRAVAKAARTGYGTEAR